VYLSFQFAADFTEKTLFKLVMIRLLKAAVTSSKEDLAALLTEEILNVDSQLLEIEKDMHEVSGMCVCVTACMLVFSVSYSGMR